MKLQEFYEFLIKEGIRQDPRGQKQVSLMLKEQKKQFNKLSAHEKKRFDYDKLMNPYIDTRILYGDRQMQVKSLAIGIDVDTSELLLVDRLRNHKQIDCVMSHHPQGYAYASLSEVMSLQADLLADLGISKDVARDLVQKRAKEVERKIHAVNHQRAVDAARILDIPFLCAHTVADNCVTSFLQKIVNKNKPKDLKDILNILTSIPEYQKADSQGAGPKIVIGDSKKSAGKVVVDMTGGTEGPKNIFSRLSQTGVSTLVCMHLSEEHFQKATEEYINVIVAGHISSDSLGINILLDKVEKQFGKLDIISFSGFRRIRHA